MALSLTPAKVVRRRARRGALLGVGKHLDPGASEQLTVKLKPGRYELVCHVPGHYAAGQKLPFTVTE